jgi:hypothetical protein
VLVSSTVKDLVNGSGITFQDRGSHALKGIPGEWKLFAPVGEHDPMDAVNAAPQEPVQDPWVDRLKGQPRLGRMLLRMARKR